MKYVAKLLILVFIFSIIAPLKAAEKQGGINLKVGENFYFEGNVTDSQDDSKEASMAEIKQVPFWETTWFITAVSIIAVAGATTGVYFLAQTDDRPLNTISFEQD